MIFKRKVYDQLLEWKEKFSRRYAVMLEGPRRVGKSTIAEEFARRHFRSYIRIDFADITPERIKAIFSSLATPDLLFLQLQADTGIQLYPGESVIIFDEIQRAPPVRQAIKYLVADGRYSYIETGSLISIRQNIRNIVIPSEEYFISVNPLDFEEFLLATGNQAYGILRELYHRNKPVGSQTNTKLMRDLRLYMAVGGMPQAVESYIGKNNFVEIDRIKRSILDLYEQDFYRIDKSGILAKMFTSIPSQLGHNKKRFVLSQASGKRTTAKDLERFSELVDSKTVQVSYDTADPGIALGSTARPDSYKVYLSDTGLFTSLLFSSADQTSSQIYSKLLSDKLSANLGYLYENAAAQMITASGNKLFHHTWKKEGSTHHHEIDFLIQAGTKIVPIEIKSSSINSHSSITAFSLKYPGRILSQYLFSQKDVSHRETLLCKPLWMLPFVLEELGQAEITGR